MRRTTAALTALLVPAFARAEEAVTMTADKQGTPAEPVIDPTLSFAIAAVALCVALYAVHRLVNRKVR
jgi:hypothetical protein